MNTNDGKLRRWATKEKERANEALNDATSRPELIYVIAGFLLVPFVLFTHSEMNGWPQTIASWLIFAATLCTFAFGMYLVLWVIRTAATRTPIRIQHWARVILGVVLIPLAFWVCMQLFALLIHGYV